MSKLRFELLKVNLNGASGDTFLERVEGVWTEAVGELTQSVLPALKEELGDPNFFSEGSDQDIPEHIKSDSELFAYRQLVGTAFKWLVNAGSDLAEAAGGNAEMTAEELVTACMSTLDEVLFQDACGCEPGEAPVIVRVSATGLGALAVFATPREMIAHTEVPILINTIVPGLPAAV